MNHTKRKHSLQLKEESQNSIQNLTYALEAVRDFRQLKGERKKRPGYMDPILFECSQMLENYLISEKRQKKQGDINPIFFQLSQMIENHPILKEDENIKAKYIQFLEYFTRKYSPNNKWAHSVLELYIEKLLTDSTKYIFDDSNISQKNQNVIATRFKPFKFFSYRYSLIFDCIFINAYDDPKKAKKIFKKLSSIYDKRHRSKLRRVFRFLYDHSINIDGIDQIEYMKSCWDKNRKFLSIPPRKIVITANMSAGKSTLLNALVGKRVTKTQNDACTAKVHYIINKAYEDNLCYENDYLLKLDANLETLMDDNTDNKSSEIFVGTHFRTVIFDHKPLWLIDTPGVNSSQDLLHKTISENAIKNLTPHLLIFLLNGENIGTDDEHKHLRFIQENYHGNILFVINKLDRFRNGEDSVPETLSTVLTDLKNIGFIDPVVVPISAYAAYLAKMKIFGEELNEDEEFDYSRMSRKMNKEEYQFNRYFPDYTQFQGKLEDTDAYTLLLHSGILNLENMIYNLK